MCNCYWQKKTTKKMGVAKMLNTLIYIISTNGWQIIIFTYSLHDLFCHHFTSGKE